MMKQNRKHTKCHGSRSVAFGVYDEMGTSTVMQSLTETGAPQYAILKSYSIAFFIQKS